MSPRTICLFLLIPVLAACSRGPDQSSLQQDLQAQLDSGFQQGLFKVVSLNRQGSAPILASGEKRILVYHNSGIEFLQAYRLGSWSDVGLASLGGLLGATEKGISGVNPSGNEAGDVILVHGRSTYREADGTWQIEAGTQDAAVDPAGLALDNAAPPSSLKQMVTRLQTVADDVDRSQQGIVKQELSLALRKIQLQLDRETGVETLVTGEQAGEYYAIGQALQSVLEGGALRLASYDSAGSVENLELLNAGAVTVALAQNDIAAMAYEGQGMFDGRAPMQNLRALGSLFPEPIQVVVLDSSDISTVADLKGRKVDVGAPGSGSRADAELVLEAHGIPLSDLAEAREDGLAASLEAIQSGEIDAFLTTLAAPARRLQDLAASQPIRLLSLEPEAVVELRRSHPALVPLTVPANTYPGQTQPAETLAVTAMLVAREDLAEEVAEALVNQVYDNVEAISRDTFLGASISRGNAREGVTIPLHPGAERAL